MVEAVDGKPRQSSTEKLRQDVQAIVRAGVSKARAGQRKEAWELFCQATRLDPKNETAWLWRAGVTDDLHEAWECLQKVLTINPRNRQARSGLAWTRSRMRAKATQARETVMSPRILHPAPSSEEIFQEEEARPSRRSACLIFAFATLLFGVLLALAGWVLVSGAGAEAWRMILSTPTPTATSTPTKGERIVQLLPAFNAAWEAQDWPQAISLLERIRAIDTYYPGLRQRLCAAYLLHGIELAKADRLGEAIIRFDQALALDPYEQTAQRERELAYTYMEGLARHQEGDWAGAIEKLSRLNPDYKQARLLLYDAHYKLGLAHQKAGRLLEAEAEYERALEINGHGQEAQAKLAEVRLLLTPTPTPIPPKHIEIDISEQRLYAYEGQTLVYKFICSTGEPGRETKPGQYKVLSKIPKAYASIWDLDMPYWLGIYPVGKYENGIHALPIVRSTGRKMWVGLLGKPVSYGCIILSDEDAQTLYNWAEIGTPVLIRY
ncbi:MAG: L,D-transpeptidase family protein [Anaerolineae bacterium]